MQNIYFDHAATTPVDKRVLEAMLPYFSEIYGNASSLHSFGQEALKAIDEARVQVANFLGCETNEIIFTSGATEADNLAIMGVIFASNYLEKKIHIITTEFEHPAVLETCKYLEKQGVEVSYIKPGSDGVIKVSDIEKEIKDNTLLISVMYVNNEIGTIQPIKEIGELVKKINAERNNKIYLHTDAVQAALYCEMKVNNLGVDLLALSGHKIYGSKGVGVLYIKKGTRLQSIQHGGHHEFGKRAGTLNTPLMVGMGKAVELIKEYNQEKIKNLRDYLWQELQKNITDVTLNGSWKERTPANLNISVQGVEGEALLLGLDMAGIAISTGSACSSGSLEPSHVLMSIGLSHEAAHGSLRITLGEENTQEEIDYFVQQLGQLAEKFRQMAPK